jgi:nucleotide-binding universal stress UspA family protein
MGLAVEVARRFGSEVILLQVVPEDSSEHEMAGRYLTSVEETLRQQQVDCRERVTASGSAHTEIVSFAIREGVSLIIMSTHGKSGRRTLEAGSVAAGVLSESRVSVLFAKPTEYRMLGGSI